MAVLFLKSVSRPSDARLLCQHKSPLLAPGEPVDAWHVEQGGGRHSLQEWELNGHEVPTKIASLETS